MNNELYEKLSRLQWLLHKHQLRSYAAGGPMADPTRGQGRILAMLKMQDGISTKDLSYLLGIRISSLNELLLKLEKSGFITREPSDADKRVILIKLTEKGRQERQEETNVGDIFDCLSKEEQEIFGQYLDRLIASLEAYSRDDSCNEAEWARAARNFMGDEMFERLASLHDHHGPHKEFLRNGAFSGFSHNPHFGGDHSDGDHFGGDHRPWNTKDEDEEE